MRLRDIQIRINKNLNNLVVGSKYVARVKKTRIEE